MALIVQKYGGTSVADPDRVKAVAEHVAKTKREGNDVVVVVSAPAGMTDDLTNRAYKISDMPNPREMDMLLSTGEQISIALTAMALQELGLKAVSHTGSQVCIRTDDAHQKARIVDINASKIGRELAADNVVIIAGFVTIVDLLLQAYVPALSESLGVFIPLIVVNCIIIGRAEAFAAKNSIGASALDGIFQGLGYTIVLTIMCIIREFLGSGSFGKGIINTINGIGTGNGLQIFPEEFGAKLLTMPFGGFLTLGCLIALMQYALRKSAEKKEKEGNK